MRHFSRMFSVSLAVLLVLTACATEMPESDILCRFTWETTPSFDVASEMSPGALAEAGDGVVHVQGQAFDPCFGATLVARGSKTADTLVLEIDWPESTICADMTRGFVYEATFSPLEPGEYRVRVSQRVLVREPWSYPFVTTLDTTVRVLNDGADA